MTDAATTESSLVFRSPSSQTWQQPKAADESPNGGRSAMGTDKLKEHLLVSMQMQHLVVLAGSGCSIAAGMPTMKKLWKRAVGDEPSDEAKAVAQRVKYDLKKHQDLEALLSRCEAFLYVQKDGEVAKFLNASKKIILDECSKPLPVESLSAHETFLHRLSRRRTRDERLKIFTTNYDLCFEKATSALGGVALDGFSFAAPRRYDPRYFGYDIIRRPRGNDNVGNYLEGVFLLYKLHGSVSWSKDGGEIISGESNLAPSKACLIYPAMGKYQQSYTQPYLEAMAQYLTALREPNTCVIVVGFGFRDDHLAGPLLEAVRSNPHLRLIVVDPEAKNKAKADGPKHWADLSKRSGHGDDIWFVSAEFAKFSNMVPDLKALTPAERLEKSLKGVARNQ